MSTPRNESHNTEDHESRLKRDDSLDRQPSSQPTTAKEKKEKDAYLHEEMNKEDALCLDQESEIMWVAHVLALIQEREDKKNGVKGEKSKTVDELIEKLKEDVFSDKSDLEKFYLTKRPSNKTKTEWYRSLHEKLKKLKDDEAKDKSSKNLNEIFSERFIDATKSIQKCIQERDREHEDKCEPLDIDLENSWMFMNSGGETKLGNFFNALCKLKSVKINMQECHMSDKVKEMLLKELNGCEAGTKIDIWWHTRNLGEWKEHVESCEIDLFECHKFHELLIIDEPDSRSRKGTKNKLRRKKSLRMETIQNIVEENLENPGKLLGLSKEQLQQIIDQIVSKSSCKEEGKEKIEKVLEQMKQKVKCEFKLKKKFANFLRSNFADPDDSNDDFCSTAIHFPISSSFSNENMLAKRCVSLRCQEGKIKDFVDGQIAKRPFTEVHRKGNIINKWAHKMLNMCSKSNTTFKKFFHKNVPKSWRRPDWEQQEEWNDFFALMKMKEAFQDEDYASIQAPDWRISEHTPRWRHFVASLFYRHGPHFFFARWFIVLCHSFALFLPKLAEDAFEDQNDTFVNSTTSTTLLIPYALEQVCDDVPASTHNAYIDPVSSYRVILVLAFLFAFLWNVVEPIVDLILKRMKADASEAKKAEANELFDTENLTDILNVDADENRRFRSFFFLVQSMTLTLNFGQIFIWDVSSESFSSPFCRVAYITTAPFMKAVVFPMFYCLNYLHDSSGKLLYHNPLTDSMLAIPSFYMLILRWTYIIFIFPVSVIFFVDVLGGFLIPLLLFYLFYIFTAGFSTDDNDDDWGSRLHTFFLRNPEQRFQELMYNESQMKEENWDDFRVNRAVTCQMLVRRLRIYVIFTGCIAGTALLSWYEGAGFSFLCDSFKENLGIGNGASQFEWSAKYFEGLFVGLFWIFEPKAWTIQNLGAMLSDIFQWPKELSLVSQISLLLSIYTLLMEYIPIYWSKLMLHIYPNGWLFAHKNDPRRPSTKAENDQDKKANSNKKPGSPF